MDGVNSDFTLNKLWLFFSRAGGGSGVFETLRKGPSRPGGTFGEKMCRKGSQTRQKNFFEKKSCVKTPFVTTKNMYELNRNGRQFKNRLRA